MISAPPALLPSRERVSACPPTCVTHLGTVLALKIGPLAHVCWVRKGDICWGRRPWSNVCSGPILGVNTVPGPVAVTVELYLFAPSSGFQTESFHSTLITTYRNLIQSTCALVAGVRLHDEGGVVPKGLWYSGTTCMTISCYLPTTTVIVAYR